MITRALKSVCSLFLFALLFTACAEDTTNNDDKPSAIVTSKNCVVDNNELTCLTPIINEDIDFIKSNAPIITSLDVTATNETEGTNPEYIQIITQKQLDNITGTTFPQLDRLNISNNDKLSSVDLTKFSTITKLNAINIAKISGLDDIKAKLTELALSDGNNMSLDDITNLTGLTKLELSKYADTSVNVTTLTKLTNINLSDRKSVV